MTSFPTNIKLRAMPSYPSNIIGGDGITATKENGHVVIDLAHGEFATISSIPISPTNTMLTYDTETRVYANIPSSLLGGAVAGISDAPVDGTLYGRQSAGWVHAAPLASPSFTGNPTAPTPTAGDNDTSIATTAFVTAAVGGGGNFIQSGTGAVTRTMQDKAREVVSVTDFGAVGDDSFDNFAALTAAFSSGHRHIFIPPGRFVSAPGLVIPDFVWVEGGGPGCALICNAATGDFVTVNNDSKLTNLAITHNVTRTGGTTVKLIGNNSELSNFEMIGCYNGISLIGASPAASLTGVRVYNGSMRSPSLSPNGIALAIINYSSPFIDNVLSIGLSGGGSQPTIGIFVGAGDTCIISNCHFVSFSIPLYSSPEANTTSFAAQFTNCLFDSSEDASNACVRLTPSANNSHIKNWTFTNCWAGTSAGFGVKMECSGTGTTIDGIQWCDGRIINLGHIGILIGNGVSDVFVSNTQFAACVDAAFHVIGNAKRIQFCNNICANIGGIGVNGAGVKLQDTANYVMVADNILFGNTVALTNTSTGANNIIRDNPGYNPVSVTTITLTASPHTLTNGPQPATIYVSPSGGGGATLTQGGQTLIGGTDRQMTVHLGPNEAIGIFYTAPIVVTKVTH